MNEIVKINRLPIQSAEDMIAVAKLFASSGIFGDNLNPGAGMVILSNCILEGMTPMQFQNRYHLVNGTTPSKKVDAMLVDFVKGGGTYKIIKRTPDECKAEFSKDANEMEFAFSFEEAKKESYVYTRQGKFKDNWSTPRRRANMLWKRVVSDALGVIDPIAKSGMMTPEEAEDIDNDTGAAPVKPIAEDPPKRERPKVEREEPKPEAKAKKKLVTVEAEYSEEIDYSVCPTGRYEGKKWTDLDEVTLGKFAATQRKVITPEHKVEIKKAQAELQTKTEADDKGPF